MPTSRRQFFKSPAALGLLVGTLLVASASPATVETCRMRVDSTFPELEPTCCEFKDKVLPYQPDIDVMEAQPLVSVKI